MSLLLLTKTVQVTYLLVAGCLSTSVDSECPKSSYVESWSGPVSMQECNDYIRSQEFDPTDYMPGYAAYIVKCEPKPDTM